MSLRSTVRTEVPSSLGDLLALNGPRVSRTRSSLQRRVLELFQQPFVVLGKLGGRFGSRLAG